MFFSIVIPTFNRELTILRAVNSVLSQSFESFEIIIVDDGSTDNTESLILSLKENKIRYFKTRNNGVAAARNFGIINANGDYIGFLDSDDMYEKQHLSNAFHFIKQQGDPAIVHLNFSWGTENKNNVNVNKLPAQLPEDLFKSCSLHVNCIFLKREIAVKNLFNESRELMFVEDWDFFIKLAVRYPIKILDARSAFLIDHDDRNMRKFNVFAWTKKRDALVKSLQEDPVVLSKFSNKIRIVAAHMNSLIAVNLASRKNKPDALRFFLRSIMQNPNELYSRRSLAIIKHLLFSWF